MITKNSQVYCDACKSPYLIEFSMKLSLSSSGLVRKSLVHHDHVLIVDIDNDGVVRNSQTIPLEQDPMISLIDDVADGFHYLNSEPGSPIVIDFCSSNQQFTKFIRNVIAKIFELASTNRVDDKYKFTMSTLGSRTILSSDRINLSVGPYIKLEFGELADSIKGIVLDTAEIEEKELDVEETLDPYNWVAVIVPKNKKEAYSNILDPFLSENDIPFFLESLSNQTLKDLFDFIFTTALEE